MVDKCKTEEFIYKRFFKRPMDFFLSLFALVFLLPLLLLISLLVRIELGYPIFFVQKRPGCHEKILHEDKFYTGHYEAKTA